MGNYIFLADFAPDNGCSFMRFLVRLTTMIGIAFSLLLITSLVSAVCAHAYEMSVTGCCAEQVVPSDNQTNPEAPVEKENNCGIETLSTLLPLVSVVSFQDILDFAPGYLTVLLVYPSNHIDLIDYPPEMTS